MTDVPYRNGFKEHSHKCEYFLISCMDFRFHQYLMDKLPAILGQDSVTYDYRGVVGGSKAFLGTVGRRGAFRAIRLAVDKHGIQTIILADHIDCGGYGGSNKFERSEEEEEFHRSQLHKARKIINQKFPELKTILLYQDWDKIKVVD